MPWSIRSRSPRISSLGTSEESELWPAFSVPRSTDGITLPPPGSPLRNKTVTHLSVTGFPPQRPARTINPQEVFPLKSTLRLSAVLSILLLSTGLQAQDFTKTKTMQATIPITCWWSGGQDCMHISGITGLKTGDYAYEVYDTQSCSFQDPLPPGSRPRRIDADFYVLRSNPYGSSTITVSNVAVAGEPIGASGSVALGWKVCDYDNPTAQFVHLPTFLGTTHETGIPGYVPGGQSSFSFEVSSAVASIEPVVLTIEYEVGPMLSYVSGTGQSGPVGSVLELPLTIRVSSSDPDVQLAGQPVLFEIVDGPKGPKGALDTQGGTFGSSVFTTTADASGMASTFVKLGAKDGTYTIRATAVNGVSGDPVEFQVHAGTPSEIRIWREWSWSAPPIAGDAFTISLSQTGLFKAIAYDSNGAGLGPIDVTWTVELPKGKAGKDAGEATVSAGGSTPGSTAGPSGTVTLSPQQPGNILLKATPSISGVSAASADIRIAGLFFDVDKLWDYNKDDDLAWFVPGSVVQRPGNQPPLQPTVPPAPTSPNEKTAAIQTVDVHYLHNLVSSGSLTLQITNPSQHPGVATNWPPQKVVGTDDDWLAGNENDIWLEDSAGNRTSSLMVEFDSPDDLEPDPGDTMIRLHIGDFAASGQLTATITADGKTYAPIELRIPVDDNADGLPDAGWEALQDYEKQTYLHIDSATLAPDLDSDVIEQSAKLYWTNSGKFESRGFYGDGLTAIEEYRGFVVRGSHRRLNPHWKDLFVLPDEESSTELAKFRTLPVTFHVIEPNEASTDNLGMKARVNPNLGSMPGSTQRAVRLRFANPGPYYEWEGNLFPAYTRYAGRVFQDGETYDPFVPPDAPEADPNGVYHDLSSPNGTMIAEIWPRGMIFEIRPGQDGILDSSGCFEPTVVGCDEKVEDAGEWVIRPGQDNVLDTPCHPDDLCLVSRNDCSGASYSLDRSVLYEYFVAHEGGHSLNIFHSHELSSFDEDSFCGEISGQDHGYPILDFQDFEKEQVRIHENN